jgi:hypothetical protein
MPSSRRFTRGSTVYDKTGRAYVVEDVDGGVVYCRADNDTETEFPEDALLTEAEWASRADGRRDEAIARLRQSRAYTTPVAKLDRAASEQFLAKAERLTPGLLDFAAYTIAMRLLTENRAQGADVPIVKARALFDGATPDVRAGLLADLLGARPDAIVSAARLGDNLMRAMIDQGLQPHREAFERFRDRRRR